MKRYVIPAIFVIDANSLQEAEATALAMRPNATKTELCLFDEELKTLESEIDYELSYTEAPHSYTDKSLTVATK